MASQYPEEPRPRSPMRTAFIVALLAFIGGVALMAWAVTRWEPARRLVMRSDVSTATPLPQPGMRTPALAVPSPTIAPPPQEIGPGEARIAGLEERMARVDLRAAAAAGNAARAEGLLIAFAARRAVDRGVAMGYIEGELRQRFGASQPRAVAAIIASAQNPVTLEGLQHGLEELRPRLSGAPQSENWWDATRRTISGLIVVRKMGADSPAPDQRVARAQLRVESGQVEGALAEVSRLPGRDSAGPWMAQARRYIEAHHALDIIEAAALTDTPADTPLSTDL